MRGMISFLSNIRCMEKRNIKGTTVIFDSLKMIYYKTTVYYIKIILVGCSCNFSDTAEYQISALNVKGESSVFAHVIIKSEYFPFFKNRFNFIIFE